MRAPRPTPCHAPARAGAAPAEARYHRSRPPRRRAALYGGLAVVAVVALGCGPGEEDDGLDEAPNPAPAEVGSDPTPDTPPNVGDADPEGDPAVPGQSEGVGPDPT